MLAPLAAGLTLFAFSRQVQFLALTLMSPLVMVANSIDDKRSGRKRFRDELATFRERLDRLASANSTRWSRPNASNGCGRRPTSPSWRAAPNCAPSTSGRAAATARTSCGSAPGLGSRADDRSRPELPRGGDDDLRAEARRRARRARPGPRRADHGRPRRLRGRRAPRPRRRGERRRVVDGHPGGLPAQSGGSHHRRRGRRSAAQRLDEVAPAHEIGGVAAARGRTSPRRAPKPTSCCGACSRCSTSAGAAGERDVAGRRWPWIVAVLDARLAPDPAGVARLLDECPEVGISVIWLADTAAEMPRQATEILVTRQAPGAALVGTLWSTDPEVADREIDVEQLRSDVADRVARALAPIRDASTARSPRRSRARAPLLDVLGVGKPSAEWVTEHWLAARPYGLAVPGGHGGRRAAVARPRRGRSAHADRRHVGCRQERTAAVDRRVAGGPPSADPPQLPVRRLQGRRQLDGVRRAPAHRRLRHEPRRRTVAARAHLACGPNSTGGCG